MKEANIEGTMWRCLRVFGSCKGWWGGEAEWKFSTSTPFSGVFNWPILFGKRMAQARLEARLKIFRQEYTIVSHVKIAMVLYSNMNQADALLIEPVVIQREYVKF